MYSRMIARLQEKSEQKKVNDFACRTDFLLGLVIHFPFKVMRFFLE